MNVGKDACNRNQNVCLDLGFIVKKIAFFQTGSPYKWYEITKINNRSKTSIYMNFRRFANFSSPKPNIFKLEYLRKQWAIRNEILSGTSLG